MSLDVSLKSKPEETVCVCECGHSHPAQRRIELWGWHGLTHNLNSMAKEAGLYEVCWRPEEFGFHTAAELLEPLTAGLDLLTSDPDRFKAFNPPNGWGDYDGFVEFVRAYLEACRRYPDAEVWVSR